MSVNENAVATISERAVAAMNTPAKAADILATIGAKVVKQVTRTVLQQSENMPFAIMFESAAAESMVPEAARGGAQKMAPARVCDVVNLVTGEKQLLIMNTALEGDLDRNYADNGYVGKQFLIRSHFPNDGVNPDGSVKKRRYKVYEIVEIEMEVADAASVEPVAKVADGTDPVNRKGEKPKG